MARELLAFDLGGTTCRAALIDRDGAAQSVARLESSQIAESPEPASALERGVLRLARDAGAKAPAAVVLGAPGPVSEGRAHSLPTLFGRRLEGSVDLADIVRRLWPQARVLVCNDLTAAGYRFVRDGEADFLVVTLGSGVGAKLFLDGRPRIGPQGQGGEIGHWRVPGAAAWPCDCGGKGHLGAIASGRGALQLAKAAARADVARFAASRAGGLAGGDPGGLSSPILASALRQGDPWTAQVLSPSAEALGAALAICHLATGVGRVFVTGGFAAGCGEPLRQMVWRSAQAQSWDTGLDWSAAVVFASETEEHGLIGAGVLGRRLLDGCEPCV